MQPKDRIYVALDTTDITEMTSWARLLSPHVGGFKIGMRTVWRHGIERVMREMDGIGGAAENLFIDLKPHDIPSTMAEAVEMLVGYERVKFINVHASAGVKGMRAVADKKARAKLLAVTALTSLTADDVYDIYGEQGHKHMAGTTGLVLKLAHMAAEAGCDGVICSPQEVGALKKIGGWFEHADFMTPGVRMMDGEMHDQARVATPGQAVQNGSTHLVIGRDILKPPAHRTPVASARMIADEIAAALASR